MLFRCFCGAAACSCQAGEGLKTRADRSNDAWEMLTSAETPRLAKDRTSRNQPGQHHKATFQQKESTK